MSGGQQQRVAIARALVNEPAVLLLDEPLGALDLKLRKEMQHELKKIQQEVGITFVFVTHDQEEALTMSDKIVVLKDGEIQQIGTPTDIYNEPANELVARFIGESNIIDGVMVQDKEMCIRDRVTPLFWSFRAMVGAGGLMVLLALIGAILLKTGKLANSKKYLKLMPFAMILPYLANTTGWLITEMGRQPWIVYGLQKTAEGVSTVVPASYVLISMIGFTLIYGILAVVDVILIVKYAKKSPEDLEEAPTASEEVSLWA